MCFNTVFAAYNYFKVTKNLRRSGVLFIDALIIFKYSILGSEVVQLV
jgi:hypothetical protein